MRPGSDTRNPSDSDCRLCWEGEAPAEPAGERVGQVQRELRPPGKLFNKQTRNCEMTLLIVSGKALAAGFRGATGG